MTYYEWIAYFNQMKTAPISEELITKINDSNLNYQGDIKVRYLNQIVKLINYRLNAALDKFIEKIKLIAQNKDNLIFEINDIKKEIIFAKKLATTKYFDQSTKDELTTNITKFGDEINETIKQFFSNETNNEILMIINNLNVNS